VHCEETGRPLSRCSRRVLASWTSFDLGERVTAARGAVRLACLISGAVAMDIGIWSMHYTAMLAFRLPIPVLYHGPTVLLCLMPGVVASGITLFLISPSSKTTRP
jgi:NO-binding membrane sensor protein with MHYT domain